MKLTVSTSNFISSLMLTHVGNSESECDIEKLSVRCLTGTKQINNFIESQIDADVTAALCLPGLPTEGPLWGPKEATYAVSMRYDSLIPAEYKMRARGHVIYTKIPDTLAVALLLRDIVVYTVRTPTVELIVEEYDIPALLRIKNISF